MTEFGVVLRSTTDIADHARRIEELGYDSIACGEHVAFHVPTPSSFVTLAVAAGATRRVKLVSTIVALPLYPAVLVAKMAAALDVASGGRYELGVGIGGEYPAEFQACGVALDERRARADEALEVIDRCWSERDFSFAGRFNHFEGLTIEPRPLQQPRPPIWVAGRKDGAMSRAVRLADGWLPYMYTPDMLQRSVEKVQALRQEQGPDRRAMKIGLFISVACHSDGVLARRYASERLSRHYDADFSERIRRYSIAGSPAECRARLAEYVSAGAEQVFLSSACPDEYLTTNERLLAEEVLPELR